ncbi:DUF4344 domain-containing metallopeptidase [Cognatishimia sp. F0-27]|uniref:DUF4344 domain-containing metallopeptidase n=1 Tax=Cognatishimia sp. F0-27 TaxID=2816855 RepID=UPI001D0C47F3|nr:DUF4344 domain-containing metallopeptidase [Cognatishimia sp. F0-27]MCC1491553.1 hypothetical protein [Cognatishimia sp. F0-27]
MAQDSRAESPAQTDREAFLRANILSILYHELGHAVIDLEGLPVFGKEEDAADVASVLLVELLHSPEDALQIARASAEGYKGEDILRAKAGDEIALWGEHSPDMQRLYNLVCLHYGADPDGRAAFAEAFALPEERASLCEEAFDLAWDSWTPVFDAMQARTDGAPITLHTDRDGPIADLLAKEVALLNAAYAWPEPLAMHYERCEEVNAFYDADLRAVIFCVEYVDHLDSLYDVVN